MADVPRRRRNSQGCGRVLASLAWKRPLRAAMTIEDLLHSPQRFPSVD
jgi:hypothetical protein